MFTQEDVVSFKYAILSKMALISVFEKTHTHTHIYIVVKTMLILFFKSKLVLIHHTSSGHVISKLYALTGKDSDTVINKNSLGQTSYMKKKEKERKMN